MSYTVSFEEEGYILVTVSSPCTKDDHYAALDKAISLSAQRACSKILVDLRKRRDPTLPRLRQHKMEGQKIWR